MPILQRLYSLLRRVTTLETNGVAWSRTPEVDTIQYSPQDVVPTFTPGMVYYRNGVLNVCTDVFDSIIQVGEEIQIPVVNKSGVVLSNGTPVFISGAQGNRTR